MITTQNNIKKNDTNKTHNEQLLITKIMINIRIATTNTNQEQ